MKKLLLCFVLLAVLATACKKTEEPKATDEFLYCFSDGYYGYYFETYIGQTPTTGFIMKTAVNTYDNFIENQSDFEAFKEKAQNTSMSDFLSGEMTFDYQKDVIYWTVPLNEQYLAYVAKDHDFDFVTGTYENIKQEVTANGGYCGSDEELVYQLFMDAVNKETQLKTQTIGDSFEYAGVIITVLPDIIYQFDEKSPSQQVALIPIHVTNLSGSTLTRQYFFYNSYYWKEDWVITSGDKNDLPPLEISDVKDRQEGDAYFVVRYLGAGEYRIDLVSVADAYYHIQVYVELEWE